MEGTRQRDFNALTQGQVKYVCWYTKVTHNQVFHKHTRLLIWHYFIPIYLQFASSFLHQMMPVKVKI